MVINLRQNTNDDSTAFGKWFAEVDSKEPLNLKGFAKHMTSHGKIADYQMCVGLAHPDFSVADLHRPCMTA